MTGFAGIEPRDGYNRELEGNVRPPGWINPKPSGRYNLVVIGAGTAGLVTAAGAAGLGAKVALIERHLMGGDCLNVGCVPSKAVISAARRAAAVRDAGEFGTRVPAGVEVDFGKVMERMRRLRASISPNDSAERFRRLGVDVFFGQARFVDSNTVEVEGEKLKFRKAVIATGARASLPPIAGIDDVDYLTNETVFSLTELPGRMGIIGAGPIGCEMAQSFARLGAEVFLVEAMHGILPREDRDAAAILEESMAKDGVRVLCCGRDLELAKPDGGGIRLCVESHGREYDQVVDRLLVAAGRAANVEGLGLERAGIAFSKKGVEVNDRLQTTNPHVFAAGDVCSKYRFTHAADFMARIVIQNALFFGRAKASALTIPWCTYTEPEVAHVGLYEKEARDRGMEVDTFTLDLGENDRAILEGKTAGLVRIHVRKRTDRLVGATIVAANAGDMISEVTLAMTCGLGLKKIAGTIHPYPTQGEAIRRVADLYNRSRLTPRIKWSIERWLRWRR